MIRLVCDLQTGVQSEVVLTPEEELAAYQSEAAWAAANTLDMRAARSIDAIDRLQFEHLFDLENRMRAREGLGAITRLQYRNALINRWKALNS